VADVPGGVTVLIVDQDLGFVFWLGEIFAELGCQAVPALDCTKAVSISSALNLTIDLVVVNLRLRGVSKMMKKLSRADRSVKVVVIRDGNVRAISRLPADAILERPVGQAAISRERWLNRVRKILRDVLVAGVE
jgi:hypothetical protein